MTKEVEAAGYVVSWSVGETDRILAWGTSVGEALASFAADAPEGIAFDLAVTPASRIVMAVLNHGGPDHMPGWDVREGVLCLPRGMTASQLAMVAARLTLEVPA